MTGVVVVLGGLGLLLVVWAWSGRALDSANHVAVVVVLGTFAAAFNLVVPVPNVEATTTLVVCTAAVLGMRAAVAVGLVAVLGTGITGGLGIWTGWQVVGMSVVAAGGSLLPRGAVSALSSGRRRWWLASWAGVLTIVYELVVTLPTANLVGVTQSVGGFDDRVLGLFLLGLPFTAIHCATNVMFVSLTGPSLIAALRRASMRLSLSSVGASIQDVQHTHVGFSSRPRVGGR